MDVHIALQPIPVPQGDPQFVISRFKEIAKLSLVAVPELEHGRMLFTINQGYALGHIFEGEGDLLDVITALIKDERPDAVLLEFEEETEISSKEDPTLTPIKRRALILDYKDSSGHEVVDHIFFTRQGREVNFLPDPDQSKRDVKHQMFLKDINLRERISYLG
jgi:hypothetical protein